MQSRTCFLLLVIGASAFAQPPAGRSKAQLSGLNQVPPVLTAASGEVVASLDHDAGNVSMTFTWSGLVGDAQSVQLHFGSTGVNGNVFCYICGVMGKPACPKKEGTITAVIAPVDILAIPNQGVSAGDLQALLLAIREGAVYANVITTRFPAGEIRGQLGRGKAQNKIKEPRNRKGDEDIE